MLITKYFIRISIKIKMLNFIYNIEIIFVCKNRDTIRIYSVLQLRNFVNQQLFANKYKYI